MSRISKWKLEKTKVKVVFRLQFHATHIPQSGWDKLFVSFIPADTGKATAKTTKANVRNGACKWGDAIYETTRLLQDSKTKQFDEKLYTVVVAMGSSRASILGEATINLADYVDALKPFNVSVPLHGCSFGTVLHITVQLLTSKTGFREFEQQRELRERGFRSNVDGHGDGNMGKPYSEDTTNDQSDKVIATVKSKGDNSELSSLDGDYPDSNSAVGSESLTFDKNEISFLKSATTFDQSPHTEEKDTSDQHLARGSSNYINNELAAAFEENTRLKGNLEVAESLIFNLKLEVNSLQALADELGSETKKITNLLNVEMTSSQELAKEVSAMKSECQKFKVDIVKLKKSKSSSQTLVMDTNGFGLDLCQPESILHHFNISTPPVPEVANPAVDAMKTQIFDLVRELDEAKIEKESLVQKMDQMELYYENLIQELEENQKLMVAEIKHLTNEHSTCLYALSSSRSEMELMHQEMLRLADERIEMEAISKELEIRAATSEASLRRARLNYSIAVDKLQKDLELLSSQVASMFETNQSLISKAFVEPSSNVDLIKRSTNRDIRLEEMKRSVCFQEELYRKAEEELVDLFSVNLSLDIYSRALQASLLEADSDIRNMKKMTEELTEELEISTDSQNQLMIRLQKATEDIHTLNEYKSASISQCGDMALQNQVLEDKLESVSKENQLLDQKLKDGEITMINYKSKSETCLAENAELSLSLEREVLENEKIRTEMSLLQTESEAVVSSTKSLEETISFVHDKLGNLLASYDKQLNAYAECDNLDYASTNVKDSILQLEEIQSKSCGRILQLVEENHNLETVRVTTDVSLSTARLEILEMKLKFKKEIISMANKLNVSNGLVSKLQAELESVSRKFQLRSEVEEAYVNQNEVFLADLALLENQMQELTCENGHLIREIAGFNDFAEENGREKSMICDLMRDKQELVVSLQEKTEESIKLASKIGCLKEDLRISHDELSNAKANKDELEGKVRDLTFQLNKESGEYVEESAKFASEITCLKNELENVHDELRKKITYNDELEIQVKDLTSQLSVTLKEKNEESVKLTSEVDFLKENLENLKNELHEAKVYTDDLEGKVRDLTSRLIKENGEYAEESAKLTSEINCLKEDLRSLHDELTKEMTGKDDLNKNNGKLALSLQEKNGELIELASQIGYLKENLRELESELHKEKTCKDELEGKSRDLLSQLSKENDGFVMSLQKKTDESFKLASEINSLKETWRNLNNELNVEKASKDEFEAKVRDLNSQLKKDNDKFVMSLLEKNEELEKFTSEIVLLKEDLQNLEFKLNTEKADKDELEGKIRDLTSQLSNEKDRFVMSLQDKTETSIKLASDINLLKDELRNLHDVLNAEKASKNELTVKCSQLENDNDEFVMSLRDKIEESTKLSSEIGHLKEKLRSMDDELREEKVQKAELERKFQDLTSQLNTEKDEFVISLQEKSNELASEICRLKEDLRYLDNELQKEKTSKIEVDSEVKSLRESLSHFEHQNVLINKLQEETSCQDIQLFEMHEYVLAADVELMYFAKQYEIAFEDLLQQYMSSEGCLKELEDKQSLNEEWLKNVITDLEEEIMSLNIANNELDILVLVLKGKVTEECAEVTSLRSRCDEISKKLSEQVLKTEEFTKLSVQLKEQVEEREEVQHSVASRDSLRVAFIKEQYETRNQELQHQVFMSKRHGEELLIKLQDSIDEIVNRKKSEAVNSKKYEELSLKLLQLESELQAAVTEKREKISAYDRTMAELECALLSLECCKEEKEKLEASLQEFEAEKSELAVQLTLAKGEVEILKSPIKTDQYKLNGLTRNSPVILLNQEESIASCENTEPNKPTQLRILQESTLRSMDLIPRALQIGESPKSNGKSLSVNAEYTGAQILRSSMEHLHEELEKMKIENTDPDDNHDVKDSQFPEREIMQLHKANDELRSMFPSFDEVSGGGNALEKVLALEIELAEALKGKNMQNSLFQSSFLKQHSSEEAVLKSFCDINDLIKEMLELKGRHATMDIELREMHDRYSQLSIQFAEVEGERQKLKMTLKSLRASRKLLLSSSGDQPL